MTYIIILVLILLSALFSGLTIGLLGLNKTELERKIKLGSKEASRIYTIRKNGNLLLVTLLLGNVAVNSALSIFLAERFNGLIAGLIATALIVIFGEIIPQAVFYRHALKIGYYFVPLVKFFIILLYPISWLISKILDKALGDEEVTIWSKKEIGEIIKTHEDSSRSDLDADEEKIVLGALSFSEKKVGKVMTPKAVVSFIEEKTILDKNILQKIKEGGFTRLPVFRKQHDNIIGVLNTKSLIGISEGLKVSEVYSPKKILSVNENDKLDNLLNKFIQSKIHIAYVVNDYKTLTGIVTLEDLLEEILKAEIVDETDNHHSMREEFKRKETLKK